MAAPFSTPMRRTPPGSKTLSAENYTPASHPSQKDLVKHAGEELADATWEMDASMLARVLSAKKRKKRYEDITSKDSISDYDVALDRWERVVEKKADSFTPPKLPGKKGEEREHYGPLMDYLNKCLAWCRRTVGHDVKAYNRELHFRVWDKPTKDGVKGMAPIKPDLAGTSCPLKDLTDVETMSWRPENGLREHTLEIPVEVKGDWSQLVSQAATYARCLFDGAPLRQFALVLAYNHSSQELRFLCFHAGGLTASEALKLNSEDHEVKTKIIRLFLSLLTWETRGDAGFPEWESNGVMEIQKDEKNSEGQRVKVESVLYNRLGIRGRSARVLLVKPIDSVNEKPPDSNPPEVVAQTRLRRSSRLQQKNAEKKASKSTPLGEHTSRFLLEVKTDIFTSERVPESSHQHLFAERQSKQGGFGNEASPADSEAQVVDQPPIKLYNSSDASVEFVQHTNITFNQPITPEAQHVMKLAWVEHSTAQLESEMFKECYGMFGVLIHFYSSIVHNRDGVPATNHLFLEGVVFWKVYQGSDANRAFKDFRALLQYLSEFAGESLVKVDSPKSLFIAIIHAMIGYRNILEKGYQHRDISIGNVLWLKRAKTTVNAPGMPDNQKLRALLEEHGICKECNGFVIDGDMAVELESYLRGERRSSRSGTEEFMSVDMRKPRASYFQTPIDDIWSFYWVAQWAAVFNNLSFPSSKEIPPEVQDFRVAVSGTQDQRGNAALDIHHIDGPEYGTFLVECQPIFETWYKKLRVLRKQAISHHDGRPQAEDAYYTYYFPLFKDDVDCAITDLVNIVVERYYTSV